MKKLKRKFRHFLRCYNLFCHLLKYSEGERLGQYLYNRIHPDDPFYWEDEYLLHHLYKKDEELKWSK